MNIQGKATATGCDDTPSLGSLHLGSSSGRFEGSSPWPLHPLCAGDVRRQPRRTPVHMNKLVRPPLWLPGVFAAFQEICACTHYLECSSEPRWANLQSLNNIRMQTSVPALFHLNSPAVPISWTVPDLCMARSAGTVPAKCMSGKLCISAPTCTCFLADAQRLQHGAGGHSRMLGQRWRPPHRC